MRYANQFAVGLFGEGSQDTNILRIESFDMNSLTSLNLSDICGTKNSRFDK